MLQRLDECAHPQAWVLGAKGFFQRLLRSEGANVVQAHQVAIADVQVLGSAVCHLSAGDRHQWLLHRLGEQASGVAQLAATRVMHMEAAEGTHIFGMMNPLPLWG